MSKETISIETLSKIMPLYDNIRDVFDECGEKPCRNCDFKRFGLNCQAMRIAIKLRDLNCDFVKNELLTFCNYLLSTLYETKLTEYSHDLVSSITDETLKKYLEEHNER